MGEFSLSSNTNIGLSAVESKPNQNTIFYSSTPTTTSNGTDILIQTKSYSAIMQDDPSEKSAAAVSGSSGDEMSSTVSSGVGDSISTTSTTPTDKNASLSLPAKDTDVTPSTTVNNFSEKLSDHVSSVSKSVPSLPSAFFHPAEPATPAGALWSTAIEDGFVPNLAGVNGIGFQNFPSPNQQQQLFGGNMGQNQTNQTRRAITASHNFPPQLGRQQSLSNHPLYAKGFGSWTGVPPGPPGQGWNPNSNAAASAGSAWNRGRSVLTPLQQMGVGMPPGRKPSPTFNQPQQVISPVKFRRSTSYPGKGPFPQPPTFEITNMDEVRDLLPFQVKCVFVGFYVMY